MAGFCQVCEKHTVFGRNIRHKHSGRWRRKAPRTSRTFKPNVQRRKVTVDKPIFPGYFFTAFDQEQRVTLLKTNHIVKILQPGNQRRLLHELAQIRAALAVDPSLGACEMLKTGRRVRIVSGPFQGIEGTVSTLKANTLVRLNVEMIGQAVSVEVTRDYLEVIE